MPPAEVELHTRVVGVSYVDGYPMETIYPIRDAMAEREGFARAESIPAVIIRNPDNRFDRNACEVHVPMVDRMIGHLPKDMAARVVAYIANGYSIGPCEVTSVRIHPANPDNPGIDIRVTMWKPER